jgi:hypothetical protein
MLLLQQVMQAQGYQGYGDKLNPKVPLLVAPGRDLGSHN